MTPTLLDVAGMTCSGCVRSVRAALSAVPGVTEVQVELSTGLATVTGGLPDDLTAALEAAGYDARVRHASQASATAHTPTNQSPSTP